MNLGRILAPSFLGCAPRHPIYIALDFEHFRYTSRVVFEKSHQVVHFYLRDMGYGLVL